MKLLLKLGFVGNSFCGWQVQPGKRTVQGELCAAAKSVYGCECAVTGCSRTDSGVHANAFAATLAPKGEIYGDIPPEKVPVALNRALPPDVAVFSAVPVPQNFHARYNVSSKEYIYKIWNRSERNPFYEGLAWHIGKAFDENALARMNLAASLVCGEQDFTSFMAKGSKITDPVRNVLSCAVTREGDMVELRIEANGFLYNMVRIITGTIAEVGQNKREAGEIPEIIKAKDRARAGITAPACGLYLNRVTYPEGY